MAVLLLQNGIDSMIKNNQGLLCLVIVLKFLDSAKLINYVQV